MKKITMLKQLSAFLLLLPFAFSCKKENAAPSESQQTETKLDNAETASATSSSVCTVNYTGRYTNMRGTSTPPSGYSGWAWYIKNHSNFKVTAVVERVECYGGNTISRVKETIKLKPKQEKYVGQGTYSVFSSWQITWCIAKDKLGW